MECSRVISNRNSSHLDVHVVLHTAHLTLFIVGFISSGLTVAMALSWTFLILLRFTAGFLFWFFIFGVLGIIGYGR
jgi:hypothetical protein